MRILAIDTATEACSVALWNDGTIKAHFELCPREHTQRILPMVQEILAAGDLTLTDIDAWRLVGVPAVSPACVSVLALLRGWR